MDENELITHSCLPAADVVDSAVGVPASYWFVAIVHHNTEKQSAEKLTKMGVENYLPSQPEIRVWKNGRKSKVDRIVIPSVIFIHCTEAERKEIVRIPFIYRFMTNKAGLASRTSLSKPLAVIPDAEIEKLKFMLGQSDTPVTISQREYRAGDKVRVIRGSLIGLEGEVFDTLADRIDVVVGLGLFGSARLLIDTVNLEIVNDK